MRRIPLIALGAFIFLLAPFAASAVTVLDGVTIAASETWGLAGSPYVIRNEVIVGAGATLSILPGVIVKFEDNAMLSADGTLEALGTAGEPIIFTSIYDDAAGGDTNGDGGATAPTSLDPWGLNFYGAGRLPVSTLRYATIRNSQYGAYVSGAKLSLDHVVYEESDNGFYVDGAGMLAIADSTLGGTDGDLVAADGGSYVEVIGSTMHDVFSGDVFGLYGGSMVSLFESRIEDVGFGSAIGLYSAHATTSRSVISGGMDSALEPYDGSSLTMLDTTVENFSSTGVYPYESRVIVQDSIIRGNDYGVYASGAGSEVSISGSVIADNGLYGVYDEGGAPTDARENYWGDASGPFHVGLNPGGLGNEAYGDVLFEPWLTEDPFAEEECCSSVVFIPGLEASRLYRQGILFEDKLWEPNNNGDVRQLFLSPETGESLETGIYTRDVIDEPLGFPLAGNIYKGFLSFMNGLAAGGTIAAFESLPYDWRQDVRDAAQGDIALTDGTAYRMIDRLEALAADSQTGKVTLITHSNGGLVAKALIDELARLGKAGLVDRVIMVAVPQLGTPDAVLQLLHGSKFFLGLPSKEVTRELGENMKSAYALLPSRLYFDRLPAELARPVIEFSTTTSVTEAFRNVYGNSISNYDRLRQFILGQDSGGRSEPAAADVDIPNVLKSHFLANAEALHDAQDMWTPPAGIEVIEIVGWGLDTPFGIYYDKARKRVCNEDLSVCQYQDVLDPRPILNAEGDRTVVYPSAGVLGGERYYAEINKYNDVPGNINREHKNILEINPLQELLSLLIEQGDTTTLPQFISVEKPIDESDQRFRLGVHSPVDLHLYDALGRHTGPIPNTNPDSDFTLSEEQIPNSYYFTLGEGQYAGANGATSTTVVLKSLSLGTFTFDVSTVVGGDVSETVVYEDIPVATTTVATFEMGAGIEPVLLLDIDGDGNADVEITSGGLTAEELIGIIKGLVKTLELPKGREKLLLKSLDKLGKELAKEYKKERVAKLKTALAFKKVIRLISLYEKRKWLTNNEAAELITMLENIRSMVVE